VTQVPEPVEVRDLLAGFIFADRVLFVCADGQAISVPRQQQGPGDTPEMHEPSGTTWIPEVQSAVHQGEGAVRLAVSNGPDVILAAGAVRSILMELCARNPKLVGEIYRGRTGVPAGSPVPPPPPPARARTRARPPAPES
jgi:hypothetical protein